MPSLIVAGILLLSFCCVMAAWFLWVAIQGQWWIGAFTVIMAIHAAIALHHLRIDIANRKRFRRIDALLEQGKQAIEEHRFLLAESLHEQIDAELDAIRRRV